VPAPAAVPNEPDSVKIQRDDPQIALIFKGIQSRSQSFADHPLAYDEWIYAQLNRGRNREVLPQEVFDSNGTIPVTIIFQKVNEEQLLQESAKVWHDEPFREYVLKQVPIAKQIDQHKQQYLDARQEA